tara:strand:- start:15285 stop:16808 length:1524 start_codon:yes stop_codon:yes gene_type:complete
MGTFITSNILSENGLTASTISATTIDVTTLNATTIDSTTISATTISGTTFYGNGSGLTNVSSTNLYTQDGTIGTNRVVTISDTLTFSGGSEIRVVNGRTYKEINQPSDLPTTLVTNTTYIFNGETTMTNNITCNVDGVEFIGSNRENDGVIWSGTGAFLTLTDCNFDFEKMKFSSLVSGNSILSATNVAASGYNNGRLKVLAFVNCQFRGTYDVMDVNGYDLVDINNTLFFYVKATNFGLRFRDTSKVELSSCELIRWFDESTIPTPSGYSTVSMVELQNNNLASFGAVNINGCIIHPQQTQNGIDIGTGSTTGFGTIAANAFINVGLTTGKVFLPQNVANLPDYSLTSTVKYDIFSNQGLLNSTSGALMTFIGNTNDTDIIQNVPMAIETDGLAVAQSSVRYTVSTGGRATYNGTKQVYVSLHSTLSYDKQQNGTDTFNFYFYKNGILLPQSQTTIEPTQNQTNIGSTSMTYGTLMTQNDYIEIYVENITSGDDIIVTDLQFLIRE